MSTKLGQLLVAEGLLSEQDRKTIHEASGSTAGAFAKGILALGLLDEDELAAFIADRTHFRIAAKDIFSEVDDRALGAIDTPLLRQLEVLPLRLDSNVLVVAMIDPLDRATIHQIEFFTGCKVKPLIATLRQVRSGLHRLIPGYKPIPSAFEVFMSTHMAGLKSGLPKTGLAKAGQARELVDRFQAAKSGPASAAPADAEVGLAAGLDATESPAIPAESGDIVADIAAEMANPGGMADMAPEASSVSEAAPGDDNSPPVLKPDFTAPPAVVIDESGANKALLALNKRILDISVQTEATGALRVLVDGLFAAGIEAGAIVVHAPAEGETPASFTGALWSGIDSVAGVSSGELRGELTGQLIEAIANYAPEAMESDGWIQIRNEDAAAVKATLDLVEPGEPRTAIETALATGESVILTRAFKLKAKPWDLIALVIWPNASAGHDALRAAVSNAMRAYGQKVEKGN